MTTGFVSHLELAWQEPSLAQFLRRLASFSRLIIYNKRGTGLSDPVTEPLTPDERVAELAALFGVSEGGPLCAMLAEARRVKAVFEEAHEVAAELTHQSPS